MTLQYTLRQQPQCHNCTVLDSRPTNQISYMNINRFQSVLVRYIDIIRVVCDSYRQWTCYSRAYLWTSEHVDCSCSDSPVPWCSYYATVSATHTISISAAVQTLQALQFYLWNDNPSVSYIHYYWDLLINNWKGQACNGAPTEGSKLLSVIV